MGAPGLTQAGITQVSRPRRRRSAVPPRVCDRFTARQGDEADVFGSEGHGICTVQSVRAEEAIRAAQVVAGEALREQHAAGWRSKRSSTGWPGSMQSKVPAPRDGRLRGLQGPWVGQNPKRFTRNGDPGDP